MKRNISILFFTILIHTFMSCAALVNSFTGSRMNKINKTIMSQRLPQNITAIKNISYIEDGLNGHMLDVYYPYNKKGPFPVIINIHGGGFIFGDKDTRVLYCCNLAKEGYIVYSINYRIAANENTEVKLPAQINDVIRALNWIHDSFDDFPANKEKVYLTGDSAGAYLAVMAVLVSKSGRLQSIFETPEVKINIDALGLVSAYMKIEDNTLPNSVIRRQYLNKGYNYDHLLLKNIPETRYLPPVFMTTNKDDVFDYMSYYFEEILKEKNITYQLYVPQKKGRKLTHIFNLIHLDWEESTVTNKQMLEFLSKY